MFGKYYEETYYHWSSSEKGNVLVGNYSCWAGFKRDKADAVGNFIIQQPW